MICIDAYPFLNFLNLTCHHLEDTGIGISSCTVPPDSKGTKLGSSDQKASLAAGKSNRVVLVPCCTWQCVPTIISSDLYISKVSECHLLRQMSSQ